MVYFCCCVERCCCCGIIMKSRGRFPEFRQKWWKGLTPVCFRSNCAPQTSFKNNRRFDVQRSLLFKEQGLRTVGAVKINFCPTHVILEITWSDWLCNICVSRRRFSRKNYFDYPHYLSQWKLSHSNGESFKLPDKHYRFFSIFSIHEAEI